MSLLLLIGSAEEDLELKLDQSQQTESSDQSEQSRPITTD